MALILLSKNSFRCSSGVYLNITKYIELAKLSRSERGKTVNKSLLSI